MLWLGWIVRAGFEGAAACGGGSGASGALDGGVDVGFDGFKDDAAHDGGGAEGLHAVLAAEVDVDEVHDICKYFFVISVEGVDDVGDALDESLVVAGRDGHFGGVGVGGVHFFAGVGDV